MVKKKMMMRIKRSDMVDANEQMEIPIRPPFSSLPTYLPTVSTYLPFVRYAASKADGGRNDELEEGDIYIHTHHFLRCVSHISQPTLFLSLFVSCFLFFF